jgi:hypothetical protein
MKLAPHLHRIAAAALLALAATAQAAIVEGADVGGFRTFVDTSTGTVWADLDNHLAFTGTGFGYRFTDFADYLGALTAAGFTWADMGEVALLLATIPMSTTAEYMGLGSVMGSVSFGETITLSGYAEAVGGQATRMYGQADFGTGTAGWTMTGFALLPSALNDSGLWAYVAGAPGPGPGGSVPLPGTLALAGLGLAAVRASAGCRRATA